jgi:hypothetical protein
MLGLSYQMRNLLHILPRLLHNWMNYFLLGLEHRISGMLHQKVGTLHRKLGMLVLELQTQDLHRCRTRERGSNKLTTLRKAGPSVPSGMLAREHHLAFVILLHFLQLILNDDSLVNKMLKIWVVSVEQMKLDLIFETLEKRILFLLTGGDVIGGVP